MGKITKQELSTKLLDELLAGGGGGGGNSIELTNEISEDTTRAITPKGVYDTRNEIAETTQGMFNMAMTNLGVVSEYVDELDVAIGNTTTLKTTSKELTGAINELFDRPSGSGMYAENVTKLATSNAIGKQSSSLGSASYAEGSFTMAQGNDSHAEGRNTLAKGSASHAEGSSSRAEGNASHAEGNATLANGGYSHAEGSYTVAYAPYSHVEGVGSYGGSDMAHAEGEYTVALTGAHAKVVTTDKTLKIVTLEAPLADLVVDDWVLVIFTSLNMPVRCQVSAIDGLNVTLAISTSISNVKYLVLYNAYPRTAHAEGSATLANGDYSHAEGNLTVASGKCSHAEGGTTSAKGNYSHAEGGSTSATGDYSHAEGSSTTASGAYAHAEGYSSEATAFYSHAEGGNTLASNKYSHAGGFATIADVFAGTAIGTRNKSNSGGNAAYAGTADALMIGNGTSALARSNAFRVTFDGKVYGLAAFNSTGADYAEFFEWLDGNPEAEERQGFFVTMEDEKIRKATSVDDYILGVVSVNPSVVGDSHQENWSNMYVTDEWGRIQYHYVDVPAELDEEGKTIQEARQDYVPVLNPNWNAEESYIPREKRPEWSPVGIVGKLLVRDDGTCQVNGYCTSNDEGIATASDTGYRVMKRVNPNIVQIFIK